MKKFSITTLVLGALAILAAAVAGAQSPPGDTGIQQAVARVSFLSGDVSYNRGDEPDVWQDAAVNVPMTLGDRMYLRDGRAELQLQGGNFVRLGAESDLSVLNLTDEVEQFSLQAGTASVHISRLRNQESFEVDTPNVAVTFEQPGDYRLDVDPDGNTRVAVRRGQALVAAGGGQVPLPAGSEMDVTGVDSPQYDIVALPGLDAWDRWVGQRGARSRGRSSGYVNAGVVGVEDLDQYGRWSNIPQYGRVWSPVSVEAGWQPYRAGRWGWQDPWGWTWIADEPWGWAPYHYGRWVTSSSRWFWVPVSPRAAYASYSPALVAFVGGGPGWSASFSIGGGGYVGWFPLGPRDPFVPWWGSRARIYGNVTNATYVNRNSVTVVNQNTFVSGGGIARNYVRDSSVVRQIVAAPVIRGALPVMPAAGALRVSGITAGAARPPAPVNSRAVVTRLAPPPAPPTFQSKVAAIREQRGAPVTAAAAAQLSIQTHQGARALHPVRPVAAPSGAVTFRAKSASAIAPQAVTAPRGKVLATSDRPLVSTPAAAGRPEIKAPERIAPNAVASPGRATQQPLAPRGQGAQPPARERQINNPPPQRSVEAPPPRAQESVRPTPPENRQPERQINTPPPKQSFQKAPPPRVRESNPAATPESRQLRPRDNPPPERSFRPAPPPKAQESNPQATPESRQLQPRGNPPPKQSFQPAPPPPTQNNDRPAVQERQQPPARNPESRPAPQANRSAPPPQRQAAPPPDKGKQQKKPDTRKKKDESSTTSEAPPKTR